MNDDNAKKMLDRYYLHLDLVRQRRRFFPRHHALLDPVKIVVLKLVHQLVEWSSVVLVEPFRVAAHVAKKGA